jgi:transposase
LREGNCAVSGTIWFWRTKWIAHLVRHGLIAKSFVPPAPQRELRELLRYRRKLVESQAAERNRPKGGWEEHHRFLLATQLRRLEGAEQDIAALDDRIEAKLARYRVQHALLMQIPGVEWAVAAALIAEIGVDISVFLRSTISLHGLCGVPGNHESAGTTLVGAAISAARAPSHRSCDPARYGYAGHCRR